MLWCLPARTSTKGYEDRQGRLWIGTHDRGVLCYDGQTFQAFTRQEGLAGNGVYSIQEDREGALWFGTPRGLTRYDGHTFHTPESSRPYPFLWGSCIDASGHLWFGLGRRPHCPPAVGRWDGTRFALIPLTEKALPSGQSIQQVAVDGEQHIGCGGDGLYCYDPKKDQVRVFESFPEQIHSLLRAPMEASG